MMRIRLLPSILLAISASCGKPVPEFQACPKCCTWYAKADAEKDVRIGKDRKCPSCGSTLEVLDKPERAAILALKQVAVAEDDFRRNDRDRDNVPDYGTLQELAQAKLINQEIGAGSMLGYRFEGGPGKAAPEHTWYVVAVPENAQAGSKHFFANHEATLGWSDRPIPADPQTCRTPDGLQPWKD